MRTKDSRVYFGILLGGLLASVSACDTSTDTQAAPAKSERMAGGAQVHARKSISRRQSAYADSPPAEFHGYVCTQDCSGHEAGYQWAEEHGIEDPHDCGGNSQSFIEGCQAYAEEQEDDSDETDSED